MLLLQTLSLVPGCSSKDASCKSSHGAKDSVRTCTARISSLASGRRGGSEVDKLGRLVRLPLQGQVVHIWAHRIARAQSTVTAVAFTGTMTVVEAMMGAIHKLGLIDLAGGIINAQASVLALTSAIVARAMPFAVIVG